MQTFIDVYLILGLGLVSGLYGWVLVSSIRRHGTRATMHGAARTFLRDLPLNWRVPWAAGTFLVGIPIVIAWTTLSNGFEPSGAVALAVVWLLDLALLRRHIRAKRQRDDFPTAPGSEDPTTMKGS